MKNKNILGEKLNFDREMTLVSIISTLLILISYYWKIIPSRHWEQLILFFVVPILIIVFVFKDHPSEYGFQLGNIKLGIILTSGGIIMMAPILWLIARVSPEMQSYYQVSHQGLLLPAGVEMFGWEFLFRGWILFSYGKKIGPDAIWLQAVPFAIAHLTKPEIETLSTIFGGFAFGWIAWKTKSFLYPFLIHWFISIWIILVV